MGPILIGNACSVFALISDSVSATRRTTRAMLLFQSLGQFFYCLAGAVLKGYSAVVQNAVSIVRNLLVIRYHNVHRAVQWGLVGLAVALGFVLNNRGVLGLLPIVGNFQYSVAVFRFPDNERALKSSFLVMVLLYGIFNVVLLNLVGAASNLVVSVATIASLWAGRKRPDQTA